MDNSIVLNSLSKRYESNKLAHFYTLECQTLDSVEETSAFLNIWSKELISTFISIDRKISLEKAMESFDLGNTDVLVIDTKEKQYKVEDESIKSLFNFLKFRPSRLKNCFVLFKNSQKISKTLANKLLKTLEEPPENFVFFFLKASQEEQLATIESRTISIKLVSAKKAHKTIFANSFSEYCRNESISEELKSVLVNVSKDAYMLDELSQLIKDTPELESEVYRHAARYISTSSDYRRTQLLLDTIEKSTFEIPFNGQVKPRLARAISLVV